MFAFIVLTVATLALLAFFFPENMIKFQISIFLQCQVKLTLRPVFALQTFLKTAAFTRLKAWSSEMTMLFKTQPLLIALTACKDSQAL